MKLLDWLRPFNTLTSSEKSAPLTGRRDQPPSSPTKTKRSNISLKLSIDNYYAILATNISRIFRFVSRINYLNYVHPV